MTTNEERSAAGVDVRNWAAGDRTATGDAPSLSVVVPVYNEAANLSDGCARLLAAAEACAASFELIFVDDGSTDATSSVLAELAARHDRVRAIRLPHNSGQHHATLVGMRAAVGDITVTADADVMLDAETLGRLLAPLVQDPACDVASIVRDERGGGWLRSPSSHLVALVTNTLCRRRLRDPGSTLKALRRHVVDRALQNDILAQHLPLFVAYAGFRITEVDAPQLTYAKRPSRYRVSGLVLTLLVAMLNYSSGARALAGLLLVGGALLTGGTALCAYVVAAGMITKTALPTNVLLAGLLAIVLGAQFIAMSTLAYKLELLMRNLRLRGIPVNFPTPPAESPTETSIDAH